MNQRYIDFVPVRPQRKKPVARVRTTTTVQETTIVLPTATPRAKSQPEVVQSAPQVTPPPKQTQSSIDFTTPKKSMHSALEPHFINAEKIEKRPLSNSVAHSKPSVTTVSPVKEQPVQAPPAKAKKKQSKLGFIITVIITIILGAVAGAAVYFVLPK